MYQVRDIFRCKPGRAKELVERFRKTIPSMESKDGFRDIRVMVDAVADYWTVVVEAHFESLADFERHMAEFSARPEVREAMAGYMDLVEGGRREIWKVM